MNRKAIRGPISLISMESFACKFGWMTTRERVFDLLNVGGANDLSVHSQKEMWAWNRWLAATQPGTRRSSQSNVIEILLFSPSPNWRRISSRPWPISFSSKHKNGTKAKVSKEYGKRKSIWRFLREERAKIQRIKVIKWLKIKVLMRMSANISLKQIDIL